MRYSCSPVRTSLIYLLVTNLITYQSTTFMIFLRSLSLTNIGPFHNETRTINFEYGSYLIKAPIGSGKSFIFFDGPTFALYKKNKRPMLNMHNTE